MEKAGLKYLLIFLQGVLRIKLLLNKENIKG